MEENSSFDKLLSGCDVDEATCSLSACVAFLNLTARVIVIPVSY